MYCTYVFTNSTISIANYIIHCNMDPGEKILKARVVHKTITNKGSLFAHMKSEKKKSLFFGPHARLLYIGGWDLKKKALPAPLQKVRNHFYN